MNAKEQQIRQEKTYEGKEERQIQEVSNEEVAAPVLHSFVGFEAFSRHFRLDGQSDLCIDISAPGGSGS